MSAELARALHVVTLLGVEVVDRTDVVETTACHKVARGRVCAGHDPAGAERDGVNLVRGVCVPNDELSVLRRRDQVPPIGRPVHCVDFGKVTTKSTTGTHDDSGQGRNFIRHCSHCRHARELAG